MQFTAVFKLLLALAHVGLVVGTPAALQKRQTCQVTSCASVADCRACPDVAGGWTCLKPFDSKSQFGQLTMVSMLLRVDLYPELVMWWRDISAPWPSGSALDTRSSPRQRIP
ncbi:hypothetical protein C2E23DRAFT_861260 [Lenzites betulinus]|nr:hypothetical protein C2E23DRAFT_861260 [Lenzites betulinus]